jgi:hypothetical protein
VHEYMFQPAVQHEPPPEPDELPPELDELAPELELPPELDELDDPPEPDELDVLPPEADELPPEPDDAGESVAASVVSPIGTNSPLQPAVVDTTNPTAVNADAESEARVRVIRGSSSIDRARGKNRGRVGRFLSLVSERDGVRHGFDRAPHDACTRADRVERG